MTISLRTWWDEKYKKSLWFFLNRTKKSQFHKIKIFKGESVTRPLAGMWEPPEAGPIRLRTVLSRASRSTRAAARAISSFGVFVIRRGSMVIHSDWRTWFTWWRRWTSGSSML